VTPGQRAHWTVGTVPALVDVLRPERRGGQDGYRVRVLSGDHPGEHAEWAPTAQLGPAVMAAWSYHPGRNTYRPRGRAPRDLARRVDVDRVRRQATDRPDPTPGILARLTLAEQRATATARARTAPDRP
jgi:hypothetical protein